MGRGGGRDKGGRGQRQGREGAEAREGGGRGKGGRDRGQRQGREGAEARAGSITRLFIICREGVTEGIEWLAHRVQQTLDRRGKTA